MATGARQRGGPGYGMEGGDVLAPATRVLRQSHMRSGEP